MRHYIVVPVLALSLGLATNMQAQQADTLKRQLQIMTSEEVVLTERKPQPLQLSAPRPNRASRVKLTPESLQNRMPSISFDPLKVLAPPAPYYNRSRQRGYLELSGGLQYNAYVSAGLRAVDKRSSQLDIFANGLYSNYQLNSYSLIRQAKEQKLNLGVDYNTKLSSGAELGLTGGFKHSKYNYYGYLPLETTFTPEELSSVIAKPELQRNTFHAMLTLGPKETSEGLSYYFNPSIAYSLVSGLGHWEQRRNTNELHIGVDGQLNYKLENLGAIVLDVSANVYSYSNSTPSLPSQMHSYSNKSLLRMSPYWHYKHSAEDIGWGIKLGLGLDMYNEHEFKGALLTPRAEAYLHFGHNWQLQLSATGGLRANSLTQMLDEMPYLRILQNAQTTRKPLDLMLSIRGLATPSLELNASLQYVKYKGAVNYLALGTYSFVAGGAYINAPSETINHQAAFVPQNADGSVLRFSAGATAQLSPYVRLTGQATYNHWSQTSGTTAEPTLYGRPKFLLSSALTYRANQNVELIGGYSLRHGMYQLTDAPSHRLQMVRMPDLSQLDLSVAYHINKSWTISGAMHFVLNEKSELYYGYTAQRFSALMSLHYSF